MTSVSKRLLSLLIIITINTMKGTRSDTTTTILQVLWTFSVYLESVAIIPQLNLSNKVLFIIIIFSINLIIIITLIISPPQIVATYQLNSTQLHPHYHLDWSSSQ